MPVPVGEASESSEKTRKMTSNRLVVFGVAMAMGLVPRGSNVTTKTDETRFDVWEKGNGGEIGITYAEKGFIVNHLNQLGLRARHPGAPTLC